MKRLVSFLSLMALVAMGVSGPLFAEVSNPPAQAPTNKPSSLPPAAASAQNKVQWYTKYSEALSVSKQQNKPMVLFFTGSDWCGWCKKIDSEVFSDPEFVRLAGDRFIFVELDFPMNKMLPLDISEQNSQLKHKYGITGYPTVVVVSPEETFVAETGYRPGGGKAYAEYLLSLLQK